METLIVIHGALGSASQIAPLVPLLQDTFDVRLVELAGHGDTPIDGPYAIERFVEQVHELMAGERIESAMVFGYSMGGYVALHLAAKFPDHVRSVVTLGTKLAWTPAAAAKEIGRLNAATIRARVPTYADMLETRHAGCGGWEGVLERTKTLMTELGDRPVVDQAVLSRIESRVQLMVGDRDAIVTLDETSAAVRTLHKGALCVLPSTPHPLEQVRLPLLASLLKDAI